MFLTSRRAGPWQTNCYLVAPEAGADLVVIDPGVGAGEIVAAIAAELGCGVAGVLLTHGHIDHVASAADVAERYGVEVWIHGADRELLTEAGPILPSSRDLARDLGVHLREPDELHEIVDGQRIAVGGLSFAVIHAPGHRPGCVMFRLDDPEPGVAGWLFTGDVLFPGSIGRVDLPGGDAETMLRTLRDVVLPLDDDLVVFPGHGAQTTLGEERATNPYLQPSFLR